MLDGYNPCNLLLVGAERVLRFMQTIQQPGCTPLGSRAAQSFERSCGRALAAPPRC